jgi:hypothetical protein
MKIFVEWPTLIMMQLVSCNIVIYMSVYTDKYIYIYIYMHTHPKDLEPMTLPGTLFFSGEEVPF